MKRLDLDIELYKVSKPDFYSQYKTSRIITSTGGKATALLGSVTVAETGEPLKGVTFTFEAENNGMLKSASVAPVAVIVKKSAEKGNFRISNMADGTYIVTIKKLGFKDQQVTITVVKGETTTLKIVMEKN